MDSGEGGAVPRTDEHDLALTGEESEPLPVLAEVLEGGHRSLDLVVTGDRILPRLIQPYLCFLVSLNPYCQQGIKE
jgi:hypothetical protein